MSSELFYFPTIEKDPNHSNLNTDMPSGFEKILKNCRNIERELAYSEGLKEGERIGREIEKKKIGGTLDLLNSAIENINRVRSESITQMEEITSKLSLIIATKIIGREASLGSDVISTTLKKTIKDFELEERLRIYINPSDLKHVEQLQQDNSFRDRVEFKTDNAISKGGCIIESDSKMLDARIDSQVEIIENAFEELRLNRDDPATAE